MATLKGFLSVEVHILPMLKGVPIDNRGKDKVCVKTEANAGGKNRSVGGSHAFGFFESCIGSCLQPELISESTLSIIRTDNVILS